MAADDVATVCDAIRRWADVVVAAEAMADDALGEVTVEAPLADLGAAQWDIPLAGEVALPNTDVREAFRILGQQVTAVERTSILHSALTDKNPASTVEEAIGALLDSWSRIQREFGSSC
jgi:hypothetical protein